MRPGPLGTLDVRPDQLEELKDASSSSGVEELEQVCSLREGCRAELERELIAAQAALQQAVEDGQNDQPAETSGELEQTRSRLQQLRRDLDAAQEAKDFRACVPLQDEIGPLEKREQQLEHPTADVERLSSRRHVLLPPLSTEHLPP